MAADAYYDMGNAPAARWDRYANDLLNGYETAVDQFRYTAPRTLALLGRPFLRKGKPILDLGAGTGKVGESLVRAGFTVDGIDFSPEMLKKAKERGYRNTIVARLGGNPPPVTEEYDALLSVGLFGDFLHYSHLLEILEATRYPRVVAIAGSASKLEQKRTGVGIEDFLKENYTIQLSERRVAHLAPDITGELADVHYLFVIATK
jgi:SAM-dependent methyltransferase